jgi:hypothetical protein
MCGRQQVHTIGLIGPAKRRCAFSRSTTLRHYRRTWLNNWTKSCARLKRDPNAIDSSIRQWSLFIKGLTHILISPFGLNNNNMA